MNPLAVHYIAFDPGEKSNIGWCTFGATGFPIRLGQVDWNGLQALFKGLQDEPIKKVIAESYVLYNRKSRPVQTSQVLGSIRTWAGLIEAEYVEQPSNILPIAEKQVQVKMPGNHAESHKISAMLHGSYYLIKTGIRPSALEMQIAKERAREGS